MRDINCKADITQIIHLFYKKLMKDEFLGELFQAEVGNSLERHLETIVDFWEFNLLSSGSYKNNMFAAHQELHKKWNLDEKKFEIWLAYFNSTIDENFRGEVADRMKINASSIAAVMLSKLEGKSYFNLKD